MCACSQCFSLSKGSKINCLELRRYILTTDVCMKMRKDAAHLVYLVGVDGERWIRNPAGKSPVAEAAMNEEDCQKGHPDWCTNSSETSAKKSQMLRGMADARCHLDMESCVCRPICVHGVDNAIVVFIPKVAVLLKDCAVGWIVPTCK